MSVPNCAGVPDEYPSPFRKFDRVVRLLRSPGEIKLEVSDRRVRASITETQSKIASGETAGVGLRGMRERVKQVGGKVGIHSDGKGTSIFVTLSLAEDGASLDEKGADHPQDESGHETRYSDSQAL